MENWESYFCTVNDSTASIRFDLALRDAVPLLSRPWLLWVRVFFQSPRPDGLSDASEAPTLFKIEDALCQRIGEGCRATLCGVITTEGRREFYFYGEIHDGFREAVSTAVSAFPGYKYDSGEQNDPRWKQYLDVLYPSLKSLEQIKNIDLLDLLVREGDILTQPRTVQHWVYFPSQQSRSWFRRAAIEAGFTIFSESHAEGELPYGIIVARIQSVEQNLIDATTIELLRLAGRFEGEYDGWETQVMTQ